MLKELPAMADIANVAVPKITGVTMDVTCGTIATLNYKIPPIAFLKH